MTSADGDRVRTILRLLLGGVLVLAGIGHLTELREAFRAQVPDWLPIDQNLVVVVSGIIEIVLGTALLVGRWRVLVGTVVAAFFVAIFPGNIAQWLESKDAFGLDSDLERFVRLLFQPVLIAWALGSTGAWRAWRAGTWPSDPA